MGKMDQTLIEKINEARLEGEKKALQEPTATVVRYVPDSRNLEITLSGGKTFTVSVDLIEGLEDASDGLLSKVKLLAGGSALHWEELDVDISVNYLLKGVFGSRSWMAKIGHLGGRAVTEAKIAASRANGRRGGRPRKSAPVEGKVDSSDDGKCMLELQLSKSLEERIRENAQSEAISISSYICILLRQQLEHQTLVAEFHRVHKRLDAIETSIATWKVLIDQSNPNERFSDFMGEENLGSFALPDELKAYRSVRA